MDVNKDPYRGIHSRSGGRRASVNNTAGIAPSAATARRPSLRSNERCHRNTALQATINEIVTYGFRADGVSSLSGIIRASRRGAVYLRCRRRLVLFAAPLELGLRFACFRLLARDFIEHYL